MKRAWAVAMLLGCAGCSSRSLAIGEEAPTTSGGIVDLGAVVDLRPVADLALSCEQVKQEFDDELRPMILDQCGACHSQVSGGVGPGFIFVGTDIDQLLAEDPAPIGPLIGPSPATSGILKPCPGEVGPTVAALLQSLSDWIVTFNRACRGP